MECFVSSVIKSQNDAFSHKETENNICRRRYGHAVVRFFFLTKGSVFNRMNQCMAKPIIPRLPKKAFWDYFSFEHQCYVMRMMIGVLSRFLIGK